MKNAAALSITEERTYSARLGNRTITGLAVASTWEGFTKYTGAAGHLIVDAEQRAVSASPSLAADLAAANDAAVGLPNIGDQVAGGIFAGLTITDDKLAMLVLMPGQADDVKWDEAVKWAQLNGSRLPTRQEMITLYQNLKSEFEERWYWTGQQHEADADYAWDQNFLNGIQSFNDKSYAGRARAVRSIAI